MDAPGAFQFEPATVADTVNTAWWKQFGDPVLDQLIDDRTRQQPERQDRRRQRRAVAGGDHADALGAVPAGRLLGRRRKGEGSRHRCCRGDSELSESAVCVSGAALGELGDRPVGPHPAPVRVGAGEHARHRRGAPRRDPVAGDARSPPTTSRCAAWTNSSRSRSARSPPTTNRCGCTNCSSSTGRRRR